MLERIDIDAEPRLRAMFDCIEGSVGVVADAFRGSPAEMAGLIAEVLILRLGALMAARRHAGCCGGADIPPHEQTACAAIASAEIVAAINRIADEAGRAAS